MLAILSGEINIMKATRKNFAFFNLIQWILLLTSLFIGAISTHAEPDSKKENNIALFNNLLRVTLLVKEQYVDPARINPPAMLAAILEAVETKIPKLVISLPKSAAIELEKARSSENKPQDNESKSELSSDLKKDLKTKESLSIDLGGVKKNFDYSPQRSIWAMIFFLREVFSFIESEAKKQGLTDKAKAGDDHIEWEKIENAANNALLGTLDPHSVWLAPEYARELTLTTKGEFGGIGIVISIRDGFLTVISPIEGTPAAKKDIRPKDRIIRIEDESTINMDLNEAVNLLRGKPGTLVQVTIERPNASPSSYEPIKILERAIIKVDSVAYSLLDKEVGYLRVKAFQGNTGVEVKNAILAMKKKSSQKMTGLILDLRGNPGGLLREAIEISNLFLDGGEVVSTQGAKPDSRQVETAESGELDPNLKVVVLTNGGSASASEIVASAIKNGGPKNGRGIVVGENTFGKGSVQMLFDFPSQKSVPPAALKLTIAEYFGPNNTSMQNIGVSPDINISPVHVSKKEEISLIPEIAMREVDLEGHLSRVNNKQKNIEQIKKSQINLEYLAPTPNEEVVEYGKLDLLSLKKDFAILVASEFIKSAKGSNRKNLLENAQLVKDRLQKEEHQKIIQALKKHGIDWSEGKSTIKNALEAVVTENKATISGNKLKVSVKVKNISDQIMYQVLGKTRSKTHLFDQKELLFGKIAPGKEIERSIEFEIPKDVISRKDLMTLELMDYRREKLDELYIPLTIKGLSRPQFSHLIYIDDTKSGNGDSRLQVGEDVELTVWLKNTGEGKAYEPTVLLRNESGSKVFLKNGRFQSKELLPNQETSMKFSFRVKEPTDKVDFEIQIFDGQMHDIWRDKISIDILPKQAVKTKNFWATLKNDTGDILSKPHLSGQKIATLKEGLRFLVIKEVNDFFLAKIDDNLTGYIKKTDIKPAGTDKADAQKKTDFYTLSYDRIPAKFSLKFGDNDGLSKTETGKVIAEFNDTKHVSSLLLYVNGKKVLYKDVSKATDKEKIEHLVTLKPGVNVISLLARQNATYGQRENLIVYYDKDGHMVKALDKQVVKSAKAKS
jgi:carboxyl-terminal processing protease